MSQRILKSTSMRVMRRELKIPLDLARVGVEGEEAVRIQVVAGPEVSVPIRRRVAGRPIQKIEVRIVGTRQPCRAAARLPTVSAPGIATGLAGRRNRVRSPQQLAGLGIIGIDKAAHAGLGARDADDHFPVERERRECERETDRVVPDLDIPPHRAGPGVERHQVRIERPDK